MRTYELSIMVGNDMTTIAKSKGDAIVPSCMEFRSILKKIDKGVYSLYEFHKERSYFIAAATGEIVLSDTFEYSVHFVNDKGFHMHASLTGHEIY